MTHPLPTATPQVTGPLSLEQFYAWVETTDDGVYYELVDGWPVVNPGPVWDHQSTLVRVQRLLDPLSPPGCGAVPAPFDWVVLPDRPTIRQPDLVIAPLVGPRRLLDPPLLVVEILSPSTRHRDLVAKREEYAAAGLAHYWVVDHRVPEVVVFAGAGLPEVARARGDEVLTIAEPVAVSFTPRSLAG